MSKLAISIFFFVLLNVCTQPWRLNICFHFLPAEWLAFLMVLTNQLIEAECRILPSINLSSLVQIMACRLIGAKPLSEPMLDYCQLDPCEHISMKSWLKIQQFSLKKIHVKMSTAKWRPSCLGLNVLIWGLWKQNNTLLMFPHAAWCCPST